MKGTFSLQGGVGFCNAVRRTLLSDLEAEAPCEAVVRTNTSCQTDEFLTHRLGLIPFRRVGNGDTMELRATGPCTVRAADLVGPAFEAVHGDVEVMVLGDARQQLDLTLHFDRRPASAHARYCVCAGVGMEARGDAHVIRYETIDGSQPAQRLREALDKLEARVDGALQQLAAQPATPPHSMC